MIKRFFLGTVLVASFCAAFVSRGELANGDFSDGLEHWKASWHVFTSGDVVQLRDSEDAHALLFQGVAVSPGTYRLQFDFRSELSSTLPEDAFYDAVFVSVYEADSLAHFIAEHDRFSSAHGCVDIDSTGPYNVNGEVSESPRGDDWQRFSGTVTVSAAYAVVVFELYDLNLIPGDSTIQFDQVTLTMEAVQ